MGNVHINIASLLSDRVLSANLQYTRLKHLDTSITQFYQGRFGIALRLVESIACVQVEI